MSSSAPEIIRPAATSVSVNETTLNVELSDGRSISIPVVWYPRLANANATERNNWKLVGDGHGIHWPEVDEDIAVEALIAGKASNESQASLEKWLLSRGS